MGNLRNAPFKKLALATAIASCSAAVSAQTDSTEETILEEIIVTIDRREQSLQTYAGTAQAFKAEDLERMAVNSDFRNLQNVVSGLQITNQEGKLEVFMRGIGSADSDFSSDPSVATHYNGIYLPRPRSIGPMFFDAERVEVNKGPQGTLRGRNASGGTINIISNKPELGQLYGSIEQKIGNYNMRGTEGVINVPLTDTMAVRTALFTESHDSHYTNAYGNQIEAPGAKDDVAARVSFLFEPADNFTAYVMADYVEQNGTGFPGTFSGRTFSAGYILEELDDPWNQYFRSEGRMENRIQGISSVLTYDINDSIGVEYSFSHRSYSFYNANASREWQLGGVYPGSEAEATYARFFDDDYPAMGSQANAFPDRITWNDTFYQAEESSTMINELRFFGSTDRLVWTAGIFAMNEDYDYLSWDVGNGYFGDCDWWRADAVCGWQNGLGGENRGGGSEVSSLAVYGDATFSFTDETRLKVGLRFTDDEKTLNESNAQYQFVFDEALFADYGLNVDTSRNPYDTGLIIGSNGFELADPGLRPAPSDVQLCGQFWNQADAAANGCIIADKSNGNPNLEYFLGGIKTFGNQDNWDEFLTKNSDQIDVIIRSDFPGLNAAPTSNGEDYVNWRLGIEHDLTDDNMLYGVISNGVRAGGINRPIIVNGQQLARTWDKEELVVVELGSKNEFDFDSSSLRLNAAAFHYDYTDKVLQSLVSVPNGQQTCGDTNDQPCFTSFVFSANSADATILGLELDGGWYLDNGFEITWNSSFIDSEIEDSAVIDTRGGNRVVSVDGNMLPNTSEINGNLAFAYERDVDFGPITQFKTTLSFSGRSEYYLTPYNNTGYGVDGDGNQIVVPLGDMVPNNNSALADTGGNANGNFFRDRVDAYVQTNFSVDMKLGDDFEVAAWVNNLTEEAYSGKGFINDSVNIRYLNSPRTYGVRFKAFF